MRAQTNEEDLQWYASVLRAAEIAMGDKLSRARGGMTARDDDGHGTNDEEEE